MEVLKNKDLIEVKGGSKFGLIIGVTAVITFIVGVIDGIVRPLKCN